MPKITVEVKDQDNFDKYVKIFKRLCQRDGFIQEIRERRYFLTKREKKKLKQKKLRRGKR